MAGELFWKETAGIVTLEANGGAISSGSAVEANDATINLAAGGLANALQNLDFQFELLCQWATITSIVLGTVAAELYMIPVLDGTNVPDVDLTATTSALPMSSYLGNFTCVKAPTANTNMRFVSSVFRLRPFLYKSYLIGRAGQTISAGWTLKMLSARYQYS